MQTKNKPRKLTIDDARKVLEVVDHGLCSGLGKPIPGQMCVEAAVCFALGQEHGDEPDCVSSAVRACKIRLNDSNWSSDQARAKGMRRMAIAQLGTAGVIDDVAFAKRLAELTIRRIVPLALRDAAKVCSKHADALEAAASSASSAYSAASSARDKRLSLFAEIVIEILEELKAPAIRWLYKLAPLVKVKE